MNNEITDFSEHKEAIDLADSLNRLKKNKDFKKIVEDLFLDGGAVNLTKNFVVVKDSESMIKQIEARSFLYRFFMDIENNALAAKQDMEDLQNYKDEGDI